MSFFTLLPRPIRAWLGRRWALTQLPSDLAAGDLCSIVAGEDSFGVAKILAVHSEGFHVRIYRETFATRPNQARSADLTLGAVNDGASIGIGHLPLSRAAFGAWQPVRIACEPLQAEELEGYHIWLEEKGGYFS